MVGPSGLQREEAPGARGLQARLGSSVRRPWLLDPLCSSLVTGAALPPGRPLPQETAHRPPHVAYRQHFRCARAAHSALLSVHSSSTSAPSITHTRLSVAAAVTWGQCRVPAVPGVSPGSPPPHTWHCQQSPEEQEDFSPATHPSDLSPRLWLALCPPAHPSHPPCSVQQCSTQ